MESVYLNYNAIGYEIIAIFTFLLGTFFLTITGGGVATDGGSQGSASRLRKKSENHRKRRIPLRGMLAKRLVEPVCNDFLTVTCKLAAEKRVFQQPAGSPASVWLGVAFVAQGLYAASYLVSAAWLDPAAAYHRLGTNIFVLISALGFAGFFCNFPEPRPRVSRIVMPLYGLVSVGTAAFFAYNIVRSPRLYRFDGHLWDFDNPAVSKGVGQLIFLLILVIVGLGVWRAVSARGRERRATVGLIGAFALAAIVPGVMNVLSRTGTVSRDTFIISLTLFIITGFFMMSVLYINVSKDRTTLLGKIVGISLATVLIILQFVSYFWLKREELAFLERAGVEAYTALGLTAPDHPAYIAYRASIGEAALITQWILIAAVAFVLIGYRVFFHGALIAPLRNLLDGVRRVNAGDLRVSVAVRVEDEIGFLARSFNGMVTSISEARDELREYADQLEEKVDERTAKLQESLDQTRVLKNQQDGDYFLTSLLIKPLGTNRAGAGPVDVQFLVRQKKKFRFRKWEEEIGGDLNKSERIQLRGRPCTVFINADAMGKSLQGASGALVLGAVFESILARTRSTKSVYDQFPERWIKNTFIELQNVFESFDGSMLVSLVLGLIDDRAGVCYYINAEHPNTVLYRDGQARFVDDAFMFYKLGTRGLNGQLRVRTIQLEPGDVLIAGSDGRDDWLVERTSEGQRRINEDENVFLELVAGSKGDLSAIFSALTEQGELTDDLSLVRIGYREDEPPAPRLAPGAAGTIAEARRLLGRNRAPEAVALLEQSRVAHEKEPGPLHFEMMRMLIRLGRFAEAADIADEYIETRPGHTEAVYAAAVCARKLGRLEYAADLGERVRLRDRSHVKNLLNLARVYGRLGNRARMDQILKEVLEVEPNHAGALQLASSS